MVCAVTVQRGNMGRRLVTSMGHYLPPPILVTRSRVLGSLAGACRPIPLASDKRIHATHTFALWFLVHSRRTHPLTRGEWVSAGWSTDRSVH